MKKRYFLFSILLMLGVATNSCIYDEVVEGKDDPEVIIPPGATKKTFYLRFLPDGTMDSISVNTYAGPSLEGISPALYWGDSESTGIFMIGNDNTYMFSNRKHDFSYLSSLSADTITTELETATVYGYTPYQSSISGTMVSYTLDNIQNQSADSSTEYYMDESLEKNVFTISSISSSFSLDAGVCPLTYKSIFAFLRFQVTKSSLFVPFNLQKIKSVKLYIADENEIETPLNYTLAGNFNIDVSKAPGTSGYVGPGFSSNINNIIASVTGGENISQYQSSSPYVWFVVNPVAIRSTERLIALIETGQGDGVDFKVISTHAIPELKANTIYTLNVEASTDNTVSDGYVTTYFSDNQSSNCYIISQSGLSQIPLKTVTGVNLRGHSVDWLWASKEGGDPSFDISELIDPSTIVYNGSDGYVRFRVGTDFGKYTKGNVVLALKDASGNIVWTWHIWITDKPEDIQYDGNKFLDRNIGALSADTLSPAIDTYGFVYQWGRKDPFVGGDGVIYDESDMPLYVARTHTIVNTSATWGAGVSEWSQVGMAANTSVEESRKYPMRFFYNGESSSEADPADWLHESETDLWSDEGKTDYDPCPYGYKVSDKGDLNALHMAFDNYEIYLEDLKVNPSKPIPSIWFYNRKNSNRYWEYSYSNTVTSWPLTGMRQGRNTSGKWIGAQLKYAGTDNRMGRAFYWTSTPLSIDGKVVPGSSHRIATNGSILNGSILYSPDEYGANADAYPVRCVKMTNP